MKQWYALYVFLCSDDDVMALEELSARPALCGENPPVIDGYPYEADSKLSFGISIVVKQ